MYPTRYCDKYTKCRRNLAHSPPPKCRTFTTIFCPGIPNACELSSPQITSTVPPHGPPGSLDAEKPPDVDVGSRAAREGSASAAVVPSAAKEVKDMIVVSGAEVAVVGLQSHGYVTDQDVGVTSVRSFLLRLCYWSGHSDCA